MYDNQKTENKVFYDNIFKLFMTIFKKYLEI